MKAEKDTKFTTTKNAPIFEFLGDEPKPSIFEYVRIRIGMKLYKWGIIKGWSYNFVEGKTEFYFN